jgi:hypothetical protein
MTLILTLALFGSIPQVCGEIIDSFDALEINHYYSDEGEHVFDQLICWRWDDSRNAFVVEAWRLWKIDRYPERRFSGGCEVLFDDGEITRRVRGKVFWETWSQRDREMEDRRKFSQDQRRGLTPRRDVDEQ